MNWKQRIINLGEIKAGKKITVTFVADQDLIDVDNMISSCGCSSPRIDKNKIVVQYTPGAVPRHLQNVGFYTSENKVTITYKDRSQDILRFKAKVIKN